MSMCFINSLSFYSSYDDVTSTTTHLLPFARRAEIGNRKSLVLAIQSRISRILGEGVQG